MTGFAVLERRVNRRCGEALANAIAIVANHEHAGVFEARSEVALEYGLGYVPTFSGADLRTEEDDPIDIVTPDGEPLFRGTVKKIDRDGSGWSQLYLQADD